MPIQVLDNEGSSMVEDPVCAKCGGMMPGDAPQGLCPSCLMAIALGEETVELSSASPGDPDRPTLQEDATVPPKAADPHDAPTTAPVATTDAPTEPFRKGNESLGSLRYFGDYELLAEIARGGMGVVYRARQVSLNRPVALKMILSGNLAGEDDVKRFHIEAEAAANLDHPGIVPIYEIGEHDGQHFFSMGFVEGTSLAAKVADGPLPPREAATLAMQVAEAMHYAHDQGVIHRDLKPGNVLLDKAGHPKITDFGLAKRLKADSGLTQTGQVMGTPSFMPPEQAEGKEVGPAADVYALGAIVYCLLTGRPPFQAATPMETLIQVVEQDPVPVRRLNPAVPRDLETIALKALQKEPEKRYLSARALGVDLDHWLRGEPILARPVGPAERSLKWVKRRPLIASLSASVMVIGLLGISGIIWQWREAVAARIVANSSEITARKETEFSNRRLYDVNMALAQRSWEEWNLNLFRDILDEQHPDKQGGIDRRHFEWYYWQRKFYSGRTTLRGHTSWVVSVAFSPDGRRLASADFDRTVKLWDVAKGHEALTMKADLGYLSKVTFSPDGLRVATAGQDRTVKVWDATTGRLSRELKGHTSSVNSVAFSPDGSRIASAGADKTARVWDAVSGRQLLVFEGHANFVSSVVFSPDSGRIASSGFDGRVRLWDTTSGNEIVAIKLYTSNSPPDEGRSHDGRAISHGIPADLAFSPDGKRIAAAGFDRTVKVWDAASGQEVLILKGHTDRVETLAFSPDGSRIASAGWDQTVKVWDAVTGREIRTFRGHVGSVMSVKFSPDGTRIASSGQDQTVKLWDAVRGQEALTLKGPLNRAPRAAFSSDGVRIVASFSPDSTRIAANDEDLKLTVKVWDANTGQETPPLERETKSAIQAHETMISPDGKRTISTRFDGTVRVSDAVTGQVLFTFKGQSYMLSSLAFSPDGGRIGTSSSDGTVKVWDSFTGQEKLTLKVQSQKLFLVAFNPDGKQIASASEDGTVRVWDALTGQETLTLKGHSHSIECLKFSPDGNRLASASRDQTVKLWDTATGQETLTLKGHTSTVGGVAFSPDGRRIVSTGIDGTLKVWDARAVESFPRTISQPTGIDKIVF